MSRIFLGDLGQAGRIAAGMKAEGFELSPEAAPDEPVSGDLALVRADVGVTSSFRHRLNNPLTAVLGFAELLLRDPNLEEAVAPKVRQILENALRLREMLIKPSEADG